MSTITAPRVTTPATAADVFNRAADLLEEFGWCQGRMGLKAEGEMCMIGAVIEAGHDLGIDAISALWRWCPFPAQWNDAPGRTREQVVAQLRQLAEDVT